ncbi:MAG: prohibitin family protein [Ruminococcus sp.]|uniref:prohibitin family protein n=1 Tax=Ruminococcus sp. TaxID=41978 RepID=UPI001B0AF9B4|nr:prohibitin family protein [Ruminococcus sp.]MBO7474030.1 prohibitin family protein [Ruminococcus sp.]
MSVNVRELSNAPKKMSFKGLKWLIAALVALFIAANAFTIVPAGHTGVVLTLGEVSSNPLSEGFHVKAPFIQTVEKMSNKIQVYQTDASAVSRDLQTVKSTIAVNYRLVSDMTPKMYKDTGMDYETILMMPVVQECMKSATAKYNAEQLITERESVSNEVKASLDEKLNGYGIYIEKFNIVNFDFSKEFNEAIEAKQVAEQNLLKTKTEQEQAKVVAKTEAEKKVIAANAEAEAILAQANAQAEANKLLEESLSSKVIAYEQIQKWNGVMPKVTGSDGGLLIDVDIDDTAPNTATSN